ncbi:MAG: class I SAM-dependent methyltransferase [Chitinispirillaceae bacterium]
MNTSSVTCRICQGPCSPCGLVDNHPFVECRTCGFVFCTSITQEQLSDWYRRGYHGVQDGAPDIGWANENFLEPVWKYLPRSGLTIMDFGAGTSLVGSLLRQRGNRVIEVDIAHSHSSHPDRHTGDIHTLPISAGRFDLIYSFQVFEHIAEPLPILEQFTLLVKPGGYIYIHTDMETPERLESFRKWWYVTPPDHCSFYRHRTFERFIKNRPLEIVYRDPKSVLMQSAFTVPDQP